MEKVNEMIKKNIIIILSLCLCFVLFGCSSQKSEETNPETEEIINKIPEFEFPDSCFNRFFSKDEKDNVYFKAGKKLYKMNNHQKLSVVSDLLINNKYLIMYSQYYNNSIYLLLLSVNSAVHHKPGIAKINPDGTHFEYLFDVNNTLDIINMFIYNDIIYFNPSTENENLIGYSLEEPYNQIDSKHYSIFDERAQQIKEAFPDYPISFEQHTYKESIYMRHKNEDESFSIIQYDVENNQKIEYPLDQDIKEIWCIDLIDDCWFIRTDQAIYEYNIDFTVGKKIFSGNQLSTYTIYDQGNGRYDVH